MVNQCIRLLLIAHTIFGLLGSFLQLICSGLIPNIPSNQNVNNFIIFEFLGHDKQWISYDYFHRFAILSTTFQGVVIAYGAQQLFTAYTFIATLLVGFEEFCWNSVL